MSAVALPIRSLARTVARTTRRDASAAWLMLAPSLLLLGAFTYWPLLQVLGRSLIEPQFGGAGTVGVGNYARLFADGHFRTAALNNLVYGVATVLPSLGIALLCAVLLRDRTRVVVVLRTLLVLPMMLPLVAAAALFGFLFLPGGGLIDHYLAWAGLGATNWLGDPALALGAVSAITVWKNVGYYMLFFLAGLAGIPEELHEAARLETNSAARRFVHITLPLLGPTLAFVGVVAMLNALTMVDQVVVMTQGGPSDATNLLLYYIYQQAEQNFDPGLAAAATVVTVAILLALAVFSLRSLERGMHSES